MNQIAASETIAAIDVSNRKRFVVSQVTAQPAPCFGVYRGVVGLGLAGCPVVMFSGFTHSNNEFATPGRAVNQHARNWNGVRVRFDHNDFLWCPRHKGTDRAYECSRLIAPEQVKGALRAVGLTSV
jgi:autotransporter strand-loop-strand O-heptosyltransferase